MAQIQVSFRRATLSDEDFEAFYKIKCDPANVKWSGFASAPNHDNFKVWYHNQIENNIREIWLAEHEGIIVGFYYIMPCDENSITGGFGVLSEYAGCGIGTQCMEQRDIRCQQEGKDSVAWVSEDNIPSKKCMLRQGYEPQNEVEVRNILKSNNLTGGGNLIAHQAFSENTSNVITVSEIGYGVLTSCSGHGIATQMICNAVQQIKTTYTIAYVSNKNLGSEKALAKNGFNQTKIFDTRKMEAFNEQQIFYLWVR